MLVSSIVCSCLLAVASAFSAPRIPKISNSAQSYGTPNPKDPVDHHEYAFEELKPVVDGDGSNRQPYYRFDVLFKMNPNVSDFYAHQHWKTVHADLTIAAKDAGIQILRYVQFHKDLKLNEQITPLLDAGVAMAPYDGMAEFHAKDYKHFEAFLLYAFNDPTIKADIAKFVDSGFQLQIMAGYENVIFGGGVDSFYGGGRHGVLASDEHLQFSSPPPKYGQE